ncbi:MAG: hypothetical protein KF784_01645 [Fimbriimonadaceae bacterium]|nr:hypothetical protein [Fimbriimonadaceae bacterium]
MLTTLLTAMVLQGATDKLPDCTLWESYLAEAAMGTASSSEFPPSGSSRALRFPTVSVNKGIGRLEIFGGTGPGDIVNGQQRVYQRIYRTDGSTWTRPAGWFTYHPQHGHIHFDDWTVFRLRVLNPNGTPGPILRTGAKTSFCILELLHYDSSAPGHNDPPGYNSCGTLQGLRPGWADIYSAGLAGQFIDLTGIADGTYYLEATVDPDNQILESDETNNTVGIPIAIGAAPPATPDPYEENDSRAQVDAAPEGGLNSPNLGLVLDYKRIGNLSLQDDDYFKFKIHAASEGDYIRVTSPYNRLGNFSAQLLNSAGSVIRSSTLSFNYEYISLAGIAQGTYYVRVFKSSSGNPDNPNYSIEIEPGGNLPPEVSVTIPDEKSYAEYAHQTFPVAWQGSDPEDDPKFVSLYLTPVQGSSAGAIPIPGYQNLSGNQGNVNVNTVGLPLGRHYIMVRATDGGMYTEAWSVAQIVIYVKGDLNFDGRIGRDEYALVRKVVLNGLEIPEEWHEICDFDEDGDVDEVDVKLMGM